MRKLVLSILVFVTINIQAQIRVDLDSFNRKNGASVKTARNTIEVSWPVDEKEKGKLVINLENKNPLFSSIGLTSNTVTKEIVKDIDPTFLLTVGKRDLVSQNGWNIFFDKVPLKPHETFRLELNKTSASVRSQGSRTVITIGQLSAPDFQGNIEITLYNGSPLINIAAVISTAKDSVAILYDAALVSKNAAWQNIAWANVYDTLKTIHPSLQDTATNQAVKYRTIIGQTRAGSVAVFPPPHQYFYPLDEAFNLKFTWYGNNYRSMVNGYGIGIRQDLYGDNRFVPWFNAPPQTKQRLNFFCLLDAGDPLSVLNKVKKFTHDDTYASLPGYKTMSSHFHNEFIMNVVMKNKPIPDTPNFVKVFKKTGIDIVHLGEFHYTAHPKGPDDARLKELHALFEQCERLSDDEFLLLPGEEPNEFFGGHWLQLFPMPVYWIMSRKNDQPYKTEHPKYGTVYRIANADEMLDLLKEVNGLAWTAHPRTKGSTGYPDKYKSEPFFKSDHFLGSAWKQMPADLSQSRLGLRVLDLMDDMNNWGEQKKVLAEADLFTIEPENEMYAHLNVNYLQLDSLPSYKAGWQSVLDALKMGKFFSSTGEVLIPSFKIDDQKVSFNVKWTFPLSFAEIVSGDGDKVYRHKINLDYTTAFGEKIFSAPVDLRGRKWARLEVWDAAVNGAFTQTVYLK